MFAINRWSSLARAFFSVVLPAFVLLLTACHPPARTAQSLDANHRFRSTRDAVISSPVVWDVDGDGVKEIAIGSWDGYFYLLDARLDDLPGWPQYSPKGFFSSPALADLDGDGVDEIVVGAESGDLFAWRVDGSDVQGFPVDIGYHVWASPLALEEGRIAVGGLEKMVVVQNDGTFAPGWPQPMSGWADATAASDGRVLAVTSLTPGDPSQGWAYAWTVDGDVLPSFPVVLSLDSDSSPVLADLDGGGQMWLIFGDDAGYLHVLDTEGQARSGFPVRAQGPAPGLPTPTPHPPGGNIYSIEASPAIADLDNDGRLEIVVGSWDSQLYVWDDAGQLREGWPVRVRDQIISSAALVDLDGDDVLDIVVGSKDGHLYGWTASGTPLSGFPYALDAPVFSSPWVGDLEHDGRADIVVGANNGIHVLRDVGPLGRVAWPMFHKDAARTGVAER